MLLNNRILLIIAVFLACSSCSQKKAAPVLLKGSIHYGKKDKSRVGIDANQSNIIVQSGDNLYDIAQTYQTSVRDLIDINDLQPPYVLQIGSKLILPDSKYHVVQAGDNLHKISRQYGMKINQLIAINSLEEPYNIIVGSKLKISHSSFKKTSLSQTNKIQEKDLQSTKVAKVVRLPNKNNKFIWPIKGEIISSFGQKPGGLYNDGINIKASDLDPVKTIEDGLVAYVGNELRGYGNLIIIKHSGGWISAYAHLSRSDVKIGNKVQKGDVIGLVGSTGNVDFPQLYFGIRKGREAVNPKLYLQ